MKAAERPHPLFLTIQDDLERLETILEEAIQTAEVPMVRDVAHHIVFSGGKRLRPALSILTHRICGGSDERAIHLAAAIELIHTASLIHDDVLDSAELRRGVVSANAKWGNHLSVLVGDFCLSLANEILASHTTRSVIACLTDAAKKTTEGEALEIIQSSDLKMDFDTYINIVTKKTAYLIAATCEAGSILANAPTRLTAALRQYGLSLGIAFQIVDDILDYTTKGNGFGKRRGTDLKEGKLTLPIIYALAKVSSEEREIIAESLLTPHYSEKDLESVTTILEKYQSIDESKEVARGYIDKAMSSLDPFKQSLEKEALIHFALFVGNREI